MAVCGPKLPLKSTQVKQYVYTFELLTSMPRARSNLYKNGSVETWEIDIKIGICNFINISSAIRICKSIRKSCIFQLKIEAEEPIKQRHTGRFGIQRHFCSASHFMFSCIRCSYRQRKMKMENDSGRFNRARFPKN